MNNTTKVKPIIGRVGGKSRLAPWILEHLSRFQWSIYCEPFCGSGAVYFRLVSEGIPEQIRARGHHPRFVLNDADSRIVQLFRTCRDYPELLAHAVKYTLYSREEHRLAQQGIEGIEDEIEQARRYLVGNWQSVSGELNKMGSKSGWPHPGEADNANGLAYVISVGSVLLNSTLNRVTAVFGLVI